MLERKIESSAVHFARYNPSTQELWLTLPKASYLYSGVPAEKVYELLDAPSAGRYYNANIRGRYDK